MSYIVLARKYRPASFSEVVGQSTVARTLQNAIEMDRIPHACIFSGPRGVGKTTMARLFAKALDCEKGPSSEPCNKCDICAGIAGGDDVDVVEIDGASNNSVEDIRSLRENAQFAASRARFKIYIIDEVHMLSRPAFNALLKTLEEPPPHVKFIFATTELNRVPDTVQSRCQRYDFVPLKTKQIEERLAFICEKEDVGVEEGVLERLSQHAEGSMRDAESALDQVISLGCGSIRMSDVNDVLGTAADEDILETIRAALSGDAGAALSGLSRMLERGCDPQMAAAQLAGFARDLAVMRTCGRETPLVRRTESVSGPMYELAGGCTEEALLYAARLLCEAERQMTRSPNAVILLEMYLLKLKDASFIEGLGDLIRDIEEGSGGPSRRVPAADQCAEKPPADAGKEGRNRVAQKAPAGTDTKVIRSSWADVIDRLKKEKMATAALLKETEPMSFENGKLILGIHSGYRFHKEHLEEFENRQLVEDIVEDVLGVRYEIQFVSIGEGESAGSKEPKSPEKARSIKEDPSVRKTAEVFNATIVSVKNV